ncbi:MAG: M48 family metallopeptidase, partial [Acidobacteriota bacterium]
MNAFGAIILLTILGKFFIDTLARWLNVRSLDPGAPPELRDLYDPAEYARSQEYARVNTRFHFLESGFHLVLFLAFWFLGGFNWLDQIVRSWGYGPILTGIIYIGILGLAGSLLSLPFDIYGTFVIEERFGFNRTTWRTFILDRLKGLLLAVVLGAPFLAVILWFFEAAGDLAWLYGWLFSTVFMLLIQFIAPIWLMPLFNKFTPLPDGELKDAISRYANSVGFAFKEIFVVDASKRSSKANAFFTGFGNNKRIALFDTLVEQQTMPEVVAVLAHEIGHYQKKHVPIMMAVNILHTFIIFYLLSFFLNSPG